MFALWLMCQECYPQVGMLYLEVLGTWEGGGGMGDFWDSILNVIEENT